MKFIKVKNNKTGIEYDWMADIQSISDLMELEEQFISRNAWCIADYLQSKDYEYQINNIFEGNPIEKSSSNHCHPKNVLYRFLNTSVLTFPENVRFSPLQFFSEKLSKAIESKVKQLALHGRILINKNDGYFVWTDDLVVLETKEDKRFPQYIIKDVQVSKWPEGIHWYITVDGKSVIIDGIEKWKSEKDAWDAAKKWIN